MKRAIAGAGVLALAAMAACGGHVAAVQGPRARAPRVHAPAGPAQVAGGIGPRPAIAPPKPFVPPSPVVFSATNGITVWLLQRPGLPIVSCAMTVPSGSSSDPAGKGGVAFATAAMLDRGAGARGAIDLARAIDDLGARIGATADLDASFVSLTVLKRNLERAFSLFADVVARPRFEPQEFQRFHALWENALLQRQEDPDATARVVYRVAFYGPDHPYGHPPDGTTRSAKKVTLEDVRRFHREAWRPDRAILACAGDVDRAGLLAVTAAAFGSWKAPATPPPPPVVPPPPSGPRPDAVLVDRPDAPQVVVAVVGPGPAASNPMGPALWRVNEAIGGSFASRLNQDLRERHGYTYGAHSFFSRSRGPGMIVSLADVVTDKTDDALGAMLADLHEFALAGPTAVEAERSRALARGELVDDYESVESIARRLAADAALGLGPGYEARAAEARDAASLSQLAAMAQDWYDPAHAMVVLVGPRQAALPALDKLHLAPQMRDAEGELLE